MPTFSAGDVEALFTLRDEMTRKLRAVRKELRDSGKDFDAQGKKVVAYESGWKRAGTQIQAHATQIRAGGAALVALGASTGAAWDSATKTIAAGTGDTGDALEQLKADYKSVLLSVPADGGQVAAGLAEIRTQTGLSGESLRLLVTDAAKAGHALDVDIGQLSAGVGQAMKRLGLDVDEGRALIADLTKASQTYGVELGTLTGQLNTYGPVLQNAGFSARDTAVFFGEMESRGIEVSRVMPGLNAAFRKWADAGKDGRVELQHVIDAMRGAGSEAEALRIATEAFGAEGAQRMTAAIRSGAIPSLADLGASLGDTTRTIDETAAATRTMQDWIGRSKNVLTGAIGPIGEYATALGGVGIALPTVASGLNLLGPAMTRIGAGARIMWAGLTGPVGLVVTAIAGAGAAIWAFRDTIAKGLAAAVEVVGNGLLRMIGLLHGWAEASDKVLRTDLAALTLGAANKVSQMSGDAQVALRSYAKSFDEAAEETSKLKREVDEFPPNPPPGIRLTEEDIKALVVAERELLVLAPEVKRTWQDMLPPVQALRYDLKILTLNSVEGSAAQRGLGEALIGTRLEAEHLSGDVGRLRDELLGLPTPQARDDFARLQMVWGQLTPAEQARATEAYAHALAGAAEAGIQLNDAQRELASGAGASWLDRYREILSPDAIGQTLARAFEGASGFLGALKSLASRVAGTFLSQFGGWLSTGLQRVLPSVFGAAGTAAGTATGTAAATATGGSLFSGLGGVIGAIPGWGWAAAGVGAAFAFFKGFGGPSKAELEARKTFGAFRERAIAEMGQTQAYIDEVQHAVNVGWDRTLAETRAAFMVTGTAAGVAYDEAFRIYGQYEKSVRDGNTALMAQIEATYAQWQQQARDTAAANIAEAEREAAARDALNVTIDRVVGYYRQARDEAKKEGTEARQAALASGKSRQEAEAIGKNAAAKAYETRKRLRIKEMAEEAAFQAALQAIKNGNARGAAAAARQAYNQTRKAGRLAFNAVETASGKTRRGLSKDFQTVRTNAKKNLDQVQHGATGNFDQILRDAKDSLSQIGTDGWDELTDTARQAVTTQKDLALKEFDALQTEMESTLGAIGGDLDRTFRGRDYTVTQHLRSTGSHQPVEPRQHGGPVRPGRPYLVGEAGPEILIPRVSGTIAPIGRSGSAAAVAGGIDYQALGLAVAAALRASPPVVTLDGRRVTASVLRHEPSMTAFEGLR